AGPGPAALRVGPSSRSKTVSPGLTSVPRVSRRALAFRSRRVEPSSAVVLPRFLNVRTDPAAVVTCKTGPPGHVARARLERARPRCQPGHRPWLGSRRGGKAHSGDAGEPAPGKPAARLASHRRHRPLRVRAGAVREVPGHLLRARRAHGRPGG